MGKKTLNVTTEEFDTELTELLMEMRASELLDIPGIYEVVSEHFNNEVLERIKQRKREEEEDGRQYG